MSSESEFEVLNPDSQGIKGSYGIVKKARSKKTGKLFAIKFLKYGIDQQGITPSAIREITILKQLSQHPNIISLKENFISQGHIYLVFQFREMNLREFFFKRNLNLTMVKSILKQLLEALHFSHGRKIMHRDIKPENILVTQLQQQNELQNLNPQLRIQLADWGLGRVFYSNRQSYTREVVSLAYRAPEILMGVKHYNQSIDVWSIGCIFGEMLLGKFVFNGLDQITYLESILKTIGVPSKNEWPYFYKVVDSESIDRLKENMIPQDQMFKKVDKEALSLLKGLLTLNPANRLSIKKALEHSFFQTKE